MNTTLPSSIRYVKSGKGGKWWGAAKSRSEVHCGWRKVPADLIEKADVGAIEALPTDIRGATQEFNALCDLLVRPSQHIWMTFAEGCMWWCTVQDGVVVNPLRESETEGHFWLKCALPWRCESVTGRHLATGNLPGIVTATAGFRATVCTPGGAKEALRIIKGEEDADALAATKARQTYETAVSVLVARLSPQDFELLTDLILTRTGWLRLGVLGGNTEGVDLEVQNAAVDEIAFVQVKSVAAQAILDDYVKRFARQRTRYARMIFVVHTPQGILQAPAGEPIQVWDRTRISELVVRLGLERWVADRL
ncbi:MAG: hypothetical protein JWR07_5121 [Nevskia sp.]|nr:hypothetical protein [Nevskia sp.]